MRQTLIRGNWFSPDERAKLSAVLGMEDNFPIQDDEVALPTAHEKIRQGRDIRFHLQIVPLYGYSCLLCGVKVLLPSGIALVEAAHIPQFSKSRNDDVSNGMALCRNHHWAFDQGLWTLSSSHEVVVALDEFTEAAPNQLPLRAYHAYRVDLSRLAVYLRPSQKNLA